MQNEFLTLRRQVIEKDFGRMNDKQLEAVLSTEGPLLVLAGAGSGKTTVLVNRIANIIKFGSAATSDDIAFTPNERDIQMLRGYLNGEFPYSDEITDLISVSPARPWEILAITFTNKAANELKERIVAKLGDSVDDIQDIWACTFHSACARILRRYGDIIGYSSHFTIYDTDDSKRVIKECQRLLDIDDKFLPVKEIIREISNLKSQFISPSEYSEEVVGDIKKRRIAEVYECYQKLLKTADAMDFDDIIVNTIHLLEENEEVRSYYQRRFKYIMVDEYQDTNYAQYRLISILAARHRNICVVGDDDQSIYKFRGATIENILNFEEQYANARTIRLEQNYRSTQTILDAANAVIANNSRRKGKNLWTANGKGEQIILHTADDEMQEARYVGNMMSSLKHDGAEWKDNAILYRANAMSNMLENVLVRMGIPYRIIGGHRFYERKEIRDALAYLTVVGNTADNVRLLRIINEPKRGIGDTTMNRAAEIAAGLGVPVFDVLKTADEFPSLSRAAVKLKAFADMIIGFQSKIETMELDELLRFILFESGYIESLSSDPATQKDRLENLNELITNIKRYVNDSEEPTLNGFLEEIALMTDIDAFNADSDCVVLMTIHSAKGLEFKNVFLVGMENGVFPGMQSMNDDTELEEERRLAYVAITRAKQRLIMTNTRSRLLFGSTSYNPPSVFVTEIPPALLEQSGSSFRRTSAPVQTERQKPLQKTAMNRTSIGVKGQTVTSSSAYKVGDTVIHKAFGRGVILVAKRMGNDDLLEIAFEDAGTKKVMAKFAKLEKV